MWLFPLIMSHVLDVRSCQSCALDLHGSVGNERSRKLIGAEELYGGLKMPLATKRAELIFVKVFLLKLNTAKYLKQPVSWKKV